jgi:hypothetical protein
MHEQHSKEGLVVVSVSLDELKDKDLALKFLQAKKATFTNLLLDEPLKFWQEKFEFVGPPTLYVFSRQGKWTRFRSDEDQIDYAVIEKLVVELLREK